MNRKETRDNMFRKAGLGKYTKRLRKLESQHKMGLVGDKFYHLEKKRLKTLIKKEA
jgi:hypothetical protein